MKLTRWPVKQIMTTYQSRGVQRRFMPPILDTTDGWDGWTSTSFAPPLWFLPVGTAQAPHCWCFDVTFLPSRILSRTSHCLSGRQPSRTILRITFSSILLTSMVEATTAAETTFLITPFICSDSKYHADNLTSTLIRFPLPSAMTTLHILAH